MLISTVSATSLLSPAVMEPAAAPTSPSSPTITSSSSHLLLIAKDEEQQQASSAAALSHIISAGSGGVVTATAADFVSLHHQHHQHKSPVLLPPPLRTLSPPHPSLVRGESAGGGVFDSPPSPPLVVGGHPREGQAASLLANKYLLLEELEGSSLHRCLHIPTRQEFVCKVMSRDSAGHSLLAAHYRVDGHPNINTIQEVVVGDERLYLVFPPSGGGDLHSYVRSRRRLREGVARHLFRQVVAAVHEVHLKGIVLRDLKLRKFVFTDESRTELKLESLEDAVVLESVEEDILSDKHGCPAYVSPEILKSNTQYSGRAADMWGLGVMLYTMLVGRYPFHGAEHSGLFAKIRKGQFSLPESLSSRAKCLIRCLLRKEPADRLTTEDVLVHPWLTGGQRDSSGGMSPSSSRSSGSSSSRRSASGQNLDNPDHVVPEYRPPPVAVAAISGTNTTAATVDPAAAFHLVFRPASEQVAAAAAAAAVMVQPSHQHSSRAAL